MTGEERSNQEIRALCDAATPGPWHLEEDWDPDLEETSPIVCGPEPRGVPRQGIAEVFEATAGDAAFIAAARTVVPSLLDRVAAAQRERDNERRRAESADRRCWAIGHPTVTPESLIPCQLDRGHEGDHFSTSGCSGGAVSWASTESQLADTRAQLDQARRDATSWQETAEAVRQQGRQQLEFDQRTAAALYEKFREARDRAEAAEARIEAVEVACDQADAMARASCDPSDPPIVAGHGDLSTVEVRAALAAPAATPDARVGYSVWLDRQAWGHVIDGLINERQAAQARKAINSESTSDIRADEIADVIKAISAADPGGCCYTRRA